MSIIAGSCSSDDDAGRAQRQPHVPVPHLRELTQMLIYEASATPRSRSSTSRRRWR
ncbi:hypothetical protein GS506_23160 [Rhodococcus hoagii]|nr:hypothetical protein [Prescottella equi]